MGLFDDVIFYCSVCATEMWAQSKGAEDPFLNRYTAGTAPPEVLAGCDGQTLLCSGCGAVWGVRAQSTTFVTLDRMPGNVKAEAPKPEHQNVTQPSLGEKAQNTQVVTSDD